MVNNGYNPIMVNQAGKVLLIFILIVVLMLSVSSYFKYWYTEKNIFKAKSPSIVGHYYGPGKVLIWDHDLDGDGYKDVRRHYIWWKKPGREGRLICIKEEVYDRWQPYIRRSNGRKYYEPK